VIEIIRENIALRKIIRGNHALGETLGVHIVIRQSFFVTISLQIVVRTYMYYVYIVRMEAKVDQASSCHLFMDVADASGRLQGIEHQIH